MTAHDIVLYGATGFVGQLVAEYLARHQEGSRFSWAIAGRNPDKLSALRTSLADAAPEIIVADTSDRRYLATKKILGEVGLCLALDHEEAPPSGGVLTPALAPGSVLRERLAAAEGGEFMQFRVLAET